MRKAIGPPGWSRLSSEKRFASTSSAPRTLDIEARTVDAILSKGSAVVRGFGVEKLRVSKSAVDLSRLETSGILVLDNHQQTSIGNALGRLTRIWFEGGSLLGRLQFNRTPNGQQALEMVERGELTALSIGYQVKQWQITDSDGRVIDTENERFRYDEDYTFEAIRWELFEVSMVTVPADAQAVVRSYGHRNSGIGRIRAVKARMRLRQRTVGIRR